MAWTDSCRTRRFMGLARGLLGAALLLGASAAQAQDFALSLTTAQAAVGRDVELVLQRPVDAALCAVEIDYGDGNTRALKLDQARVTDTHAYAKAGSYKITVTGKLWFKSLFDMATACAGPDASASVQVADAGGATASTRALGDSAASGRNLQLESVSTDKRVALVIGNNSYQSVSVLEKAVNDARAVGQALERAGFRTKSLINGSRNQMNAAINQFVEDISGGGVGVLFFAGHGVQVGSQNFLIPTDLQNISREADIADQGISLQSVQDKLADAKARFVLLVLDACRDNPLPKRAGRSLGGTRGLAQASSAEGQMVLFSAGAGQQALDKLNASDANPNGVFTREFLPWINRPGVSIRDAVQNVRSAVRASARSVQHEQFPALYDQVDGNFYFVPGSGAPVASLVPVPTPPAPVQAAPAPRPTPAPMPAAAPVANPEDALWAEVKASGAKEYYEAYLKQYPKGKYAALARVELKKLEDAERAERARQEAQRQQEAQQAEQAAWDSAKASNSEAGYQGYLTNYPRGRYATLAQAALTRVQREATQRQQLEAERQRREQAEAALREEDELWRRAQAASSSAVVQGYLDRYPGGRYATGARQRLEQLKREEAELRPGKVFRDCEECPEMVVLPAGSFPSFAMGVSEVTQAQWRAVMGNNPSFHKSCGLDCPVESVSWNDVQEYVRRLNAKTGKTYRLPTDAEWMYACSAGERYKYCGSDDLNSVAWYRQNSNGDPQPVKRKKPNAWGLYDMSGNASEWLQDAAGSGGAPERWMRSSSFQDNLSKFFGNRYSYPPQHRIVSLGFRLARTLP